ncbi:uncharacterized protein [Dysidea avara]|uniref:uncharacterized protein n=1 Tax=Dysidea avara TaxID=196820 RepID=UPI0033317B8B
MAERSPGTDSTFYVPRGTHCGSSQPSGLSGGNDDTSSSAKHCQNGLLQLRFTSLQDSQSFTYATLPGVNLTPLDWKICCAPDSDLPSEHVTYYQLTDAEKCLVDVVEEQCYVKSDVIGLIIINYNSSIYLSKEMFKKGVPKKPPMYVVALEDGEQIVEFFNTKVDDGDMMVKVLVDSDVDSVNYGPEGKISHDILKAHETGFHLHEELKRLMLNNRERIHILGAATSTFQFIFSCFQNYEAQPKRDSHNKTITKLLDNFKDGMFPKDFLFYLLVAYRLALYAKKYNSDDIIHTYLCHCIENFESLTDIQRVAEIIHSFVQRGNFTVQWYPYYQKADCAVFTLLCRMAEAMLIQSMKLKEVNNVAVYPRILWISLNLFFGLQSNIQPATLSNIWFTGLINETVLEKQKFSDQIAADFEKGFKFCQLLKLPKNALFDASSFATFLDPLKCKGLRFSHITKLIEAGVSFLSWDETFLLSFLAPLRSHYETLFLKHKDRHAVWDGCSGDNTKLGVYKEAVQFIIYLYKFSSNESEKASDMAKAIGVEIQKFLDLLINNVDLKADNAVDILKVLRNTSLPPKYRKIVMSVANQRGLEEIKQMKLTQICSLFKGNLHIWNFQFVEMFLNSYPIPSKADLTDSSWSLLLCEIIKRFSNITCKICVVGLLKRVGDAYKDDKKQHIFVSDLMKLNVPNLLLVPEDDDRDVEMAFIKIIQTFIQENGLHEVIIDQLLSILDAVKPGNHFQSLLLTVLQKEIIPNMYINEGSASYISKQLIVRSSVSVSKTVTTLSALSSIEKFYWNFIALCCCRIHVGVKDLQKLSRFAFAIENLSSIYSAYCNKRSNVSQPLCEVPEEIKHTDVREYFKWIIMMQRVLIYWQELFAEQAYNYEDILLYTEALPTIDKLAKSLNITHLVYEIDQIKVLKAHYYEHYAKCCSLMVKRSNDVDGSTTLVEMLDIYGVKLNHTLQDLLETHVVFPKDNSLVYASDVQNLRQAHQHELAQEEVLLLKQSVTSNILVKLFKELETFIEPISSNKYLKYQLAVISSSQHPSDVSCSLSDNSEECFVEPDEKIVQACVEFGIEPCPFISRCMYVKRCLQAYMEPRLLINHY